MVEIKEGKSPEVGMVMLGVKRYIRDWGINEFSRDRKVFSSDTMRKGIEIIRSDFYYPAILLDENYRRTTVHPLDIRRREASNPLDGDPNPWKNIDRLRGIYSLIPTQLRFQAEKEDGSITVRVVCSWPRKIGYLPKDSETYTFKKIVSGDLIVLDPGEWLDIRDVYADMNEGKEREPLKLIEGSIRVYVPTKEERVSWGRDPSVYGRMR
jgi:hypothetical protein